MEFPSLAPKFLMPRYKILYDRKNCIGVSSCALLAEKFWVMDKKDDKAVLVGGNKKGNDEAWELTIDEKDLEVNKDAARNCPVNVIKIYDEEGKEVSP